MTAPSVRVVRPRSVPVPLYEGGPLWPTQRPCNGCGRILGDLVAALDWTDTSDAPEAFPGSLLTDVRAECPTCTPLIPSPLEPTP